MAFAVNFNISARFGYVSIPTGIALLRIRFLLLSLLQALTVLFVISIILSASKVDNVWRNLWSSKSDKVFLRTKHGDIAAHSLFLKDKLFQSVNESVTLLYPEQVKELKTSGVLNPGDYLGKFWAPIPQVYLYPASVVRKYYNYNLSPVLVKQLLSRDHYVEKFKDRNFVVLKESNENQGDKWALFVGALQDEQYIFTLPIEKGLALTRGDSN